MEQSFRWRSRMRRDGVLLGSRLSSRWSSTRPIPEKRREREGEGGRGRKREGATSAESLAVGHG